MLLKARGGLSPLLREHVAKVPAYAFRGVGV